MLRSRNLEEGMRKERRDREEGEVERRARRVPSRVPRLQFVQNEKLQFVQARTFHHEFQ